MFIVFWVLGAVVTCSAEAILCLQVRALAQGGRYLTAWLVFQYTFAFFNFIVLTPIVPIPTPKCVPLYAEQHLMSVIFGLGALNELVLMLLAYFYSRKYFDGKHNTLLQIVISNGLSYWGATLILTVANAILQATGPPGLNYLTTVPVLAIHSVLPTRGILALRANTYTAYHGSYFCGLRLAASSQLISSDLTSPMQFTDVSTAWAHDGSSGDGEIESSCSNSDLDAFDVEGGWNKRVLSRGSSCKAGTEKV
ncbi:hypothetical protein FA15DRAFT_704328 [Coprinopsis marcescibilis]|uniref:Uncharacterized protein n=1 Tax=Coprinopsis marcescibilis TaxID=230819 RepID=A0A5C3KVV7_COPMA|nr:hypothetical protein FA15DRAFT_704328 [Coprinopsis marcescibilis]